MFGEEAEGHGGVLTSGAGVRLALLLRAGMAEIGAAGGRGRAGARGAVAATEVLVKYSKSAGAAYHRQLRVPVRLSVRGGLRVCSLRVGFGHWGCGSLAGGRDEGGKVWGTLCVAGQLPVRREGPC